MEFIGHVEPGERCNKIEDWCRKIDPIDITDEWLIRFGFIRGEGKYINLFYSTAIHKAIYAIYLNGGAVSLRRNGNIDAEVFVNIYVDYVHELQNLYFALTGEELKLSE